MIFNYKSLLMGLFAAIAVNANAADVAMTTSKGVGESFVIALNPGVHAVITWADGTADEFLSYATPKTITLKSQTFTLSSNDDITSIYAPNDGLTNIDLSKLRAKLKKLIVPGNELDALNLANYTALTELDCQDNKLTTLKVRGNSLTYLNCANNQLKEITATLTSNLQELDCANNQLTALPRAEKMPSLETLLCQNNAIESLPLTTSTNIETIVASDNKITAIDGIGKSTSLQNIWAPNNDIQSLDLSNTTVMRSLVVYNNQIDSITWSGSELPSFRYICTAGNKLYFKSMPTIYNPSSKTYSFTPHEIGEQKPFYLTDAANIGETYDWRSRLNFNAWGVNLSPTVKVTNADGQELVSGKDYKNLSRRFTFLTKQKGVQIHFTSRYYPDMELVSQAFDVVDPTGINNVEATTTDNGAWYTLQGIRVAQPTKGVYIHNGKKVIVK